MSTARQPGAAFSESEILREQQETRVQSLPAQGQPTYYGIPFLKRPTWKWHICWYFFLDGIASASFSLGALAGLVGGRRMERFRRSAHEVSFLALLPCPGLLVLDLGRPARFHHMLRVWKPKSPMNLGAWMLSLFSAAEGVSFLQSAGADNRLGPFSSVASRLPARPAEIAGLPLSVFMTAYTGVLLAGTSAPVWNQSPLLGATFLTSSFASAVDALNLEYALRDITDSKVERQLKIIGLSAKSAEAILIASHIKRSGRAGKPLWSGLRGIQLFAGLALEFSALFLPKLRKQLPPAPRLVRSTEPRDGRGAARRARIVAALVGLAGAFLIRWAFVHAGSDAADDIEASHAASQPTVSAPGWR